MLEANIFFWPPTLTSCINTSCITDTWMKKALPWPVNFLSLCLKGVWHMANAMDIYLGKIRCTSQKLCPSPPSRWRHLGFPVLGSRRDRKDPSSCWVRALRPWSVNRQGPGRLWQETAATAACRRHWWTVPRRELQAIGWRFEEIDSRSAWMRQAIDEASMHWTFSDTANAQKGNLEPGSLDRGEWPSYDLLNTELNNKWESAWYAYSQTCSKDHLCITCL